MIDLKSAKAIYVYPGVTDMRLGIFGLIRKIQNPVRDSAYVFCGRNLMTIKILYYQGSSVWLAQKRLFRGKFQWPSGGNVASVDEGILRFLLLATDKINDIETEGKELNYNLY